MTLNRLTGNLDERLKTLASIALVCRALAAIAVLRLYARVGWASYDTLGICLNLAAYVTQMIVPQSKRLLDCRRRRTAFLEEARDSGEPPRSFEASPCREGCSGGTHKKNQVPYTCQLRSPKFTPCCTTAQILRPSKHARSCDSSPIPYIIAHRSALSS